MEALVPLVRIAGVAQLGIAAVNFLLPSMLDYRRNLHRASPFVRQVFVVHAVYIVFVVTLLGTLCLGFAPLLVGSSPVGRFLAGALLLFWLPRLPVQLFYYDAAIKRRYPRLNALFLLTLLYLAVVFGLAVLSGWGLA